MEAIEVGNKTNSTVAVSLKSWHLDVRAKNCTHSATWPNYKCSHPKHQHLLLLFPSRAGRSVAIVVWLEGPLWGKTQVLGLLVCQLGELHAQFVQVSSCHLLIQLLKQRHDRWFLLDQIAIDPFILTLFCLILLLLRHFWWLMLILEISCNKSSLQINSLSSFAGSQANHFKNTVVMFKFTTLKYISVISHLLGQEVDSKGVFGGVCPQLNLSQNLQDRTGDETLQLQCFMLKRLPALTYCRQLTVPDWWRSCSWRRMDVPWRSPGWPACPQPGRWCDYRSSRGSDQPEEEEKDDSCCDCSETEQTNGKKEKTKNRYQTFQPSYLRLDVDLLDSVFGEPAHVDLTVKVSDVADDGVVLHVFKVTEGNTQLLACN